MASEAAMAGRSAPGIQRRFGAPMQVGRHDGEGNLQRGKVRGHAVRQELRAEFLRVEQCCLAE